MKRLPIILLIAIPAASVVMGAITLYLAARGPSQEIEVNVAPLGKTSWRDASPANGPEQKPEEVPPEATPETVR